jgi:hypothetical protein
MARSPLKRTGPLGKKLTLTKEENLSVSAVASPATMASSTAARIAAWSTAASAAASRG